MNGWFTRSTGFALGLLVCAISGCATIMAGGPDHVPVATNPPGATVLVDNVPVGQTPMLVALDRQRSTGQIRIEAPGFMPVTLSRKKTINGWFWVSVCLTGAVGVIVDVVSGDIKQFDDAPISIALVPASGVPAPGNAPPPGYPPPRYAPVAPPPGAPPPRYPPVAPPPPAPR